MVDDSGNDVANSSIPAAYTYFGQFVDHDITLEVADGAAAGDDRFGDILDDDMRPLTAAQARTLIRNRRTATLDLDSVYGTGTQPIPHHPTDPDRLLLGRVSEVQDDTRIPFRRPPGKSDDNDVPREGRSADAEHDRAALIGDPRNDENTIISQLQVAFLKAHNRLVHEGHDFHQARRILRQHYQHIVVHDFLPRIADTAVVDDIVTNGNRWYDALSEPFFLPLEFSVAAYRFGHTMVRADYDFNLNFNLTPGEGRIPAGLDLLFTFTALSGQLGDFDTLPESWIIEWQNIIGDPGTGGKARLFDTRLSALNRALFRLRQVDGAPEVDLAAMLSVRNLLRGYRMRMPTGQAVAELLGVRKLTPAELRDHAAGRAQRDVLTAGGFLERTPLWYYVLAEAQICAGGERLGPVGSTIVAEVIIGLVRRSEDSQHRGAVSQRRRRCVRRDLRPADRAAPERATVPSARADRDRTDHRVRHRLDGPRRGVVRNPVRVRRLCGLLRRLAHRHGVPRGGDRLLSDRTGHRSDGALVDGGGHLRHRRRDRDPDRDPRAHRVEGRTGRGHRSAQSPRVRPGCERRDQPRPRHRARTCDRPDVRRRAHRAARRVRRPRR
ncbi:peroxidase family protein [Mycobacterium sp. SMC-8]|uniref:peroxidase family protein n=1 Tax=Mycobacterium sp. SMC-8 TaxID=2857060 RepID=UPI0021B2982C|nr:peroxidase family protein [Mycobacterium sp. SMC-8]